jgi:hypothetical protein
MAQETVQSDVISIEPRARRMLQEIVGAGGKARYVRIHVGRG